MKLQIEKGRSERGNFVPSMPSMGNSRFDNGFGDSNSSMGGGMRSNTSGFGPGLDNDVFKPAGVLIINVIFISTDPLLQTVISITLRSEII